MHAGAVRDFLSLEDPARPARVVVRVVRPVSWLPEGFEHPLREVGGSIDR